MRRVAILVFLSLPLLFACGGGDSTQPTPTPPPPAPPPLPPPPPAPTPVATVTITPGSSTLVPQQSVQLSAEMRDASGNVLTGRTVIWAADSAGGLKASVSATGMVTAVGPGTTAISATSEGRSGSSAITVVDGGFVLPAGTTFTAGSGRVTIEAPAGAVGANTAVTVSPLAAPPAHPDLIAGSAWQLGPDSTTFAQPVTVRLRWLAEQLSADAVLDQIRVHRYNGSAWVPLANASVDTVARIATGTTTTFSPFALIELPSNPVPAVSTIAPTTAIAGSASLTLTVTGTGFVQTSVVRWNGSARATTYQSPTTLLAEIPASDLASAGSAAVTVFSPAPRGGTTAPITFTILPPPPPQATFVVTTTADAGAGSLRQAILDANTTPGTDSIHFNIPGAGPHTIQPLSALPPITDPVTIDGLTQPGASCASWPATLRIELRGSSAGNGSHGLTLSGDSSTVRGLVINRFVRGAGVRVDSDGNTIVCNFVGTDVTGTLPIGAPPFFNTNQEFGVLIDGGNGNVVGGTSPAARNVLSGSSQARGFPPSGNGVQLQGGATGNVIAGNFIGTDATGMVSLGNRNDGVRIVGAPGNRIGGDDHDAGVCNRSCNLIAGNVSVGIEVRENGGDSTRIEGNFIGVRLDGTRALPNQRYGIMLDQGSGTGHRGHVIGGATAPGVCSGPCNLISGNGFHGIRVDDTTVEDVTTQGNFIGTDITGFVAVPNGDGGIKTEGKNHRIGGAAPGLGNLVSGNLGFAGLELQGEDKVVHGNRIGTAVNGLAPLGNSGSGIRVTRNNKRVGGTSAGEGNTIAHNGGDGILYTDGSPTVTTGPISFLGNSIFANAGLGINLCVSVNFVTCDGVTPNDPGDADAVGANGAQNFPVLLTARLQSALTVTGTLASSASATYRIEFFVNDVLDPSGHGEGQTYLGFVSITTDGAGNAAIMATLPATGVAAGKFITATATDAAGHTSEFSAGIVVQPVGGSN